MPAIHETRKYNDDFRVLAFETDCLSFYAHWHGETEIVFVKEGRVHAGVNSQIYDLKPGDLLVVKNGSIHYYEDIGEKCKSALVLFSSDIVFTQLRKNVLLPTFISGDLLKEKNILQDVEKLITEIMDENKEKKEFYQSFVRLKICNLLALLGRNITKSNSENVKADIEMLSDFQKLIEFIDENFMNKITLEFAAKKMHFSKWYFSKVFRKHVGCGFVEYLNNVRIAKSQNMLIETDENILEIALNCGFSNLRTFNRVFKEVSGCTPSKFRAKSC